MTPVDQLAHEERKFGWIFLDEALKTFPASKIILETTHANEDRRIHNDNLYFTHFHTNVPEASKSIS